MAVPESFYIVWNPKGTRPPQFRHEGFGAASDEASRLARENPGTEFIVMAAIRSVKVNDLAVIDFVASDDRIPF